MKHLLIMSGLAMLNLSMGSLSILLENYGVACFNVGVFFFIMFMTVITERRN